MSHFLDTNVLLYADDASSGMKGKVARDLIRSSFRNPKGIISTQVLQEYYANAMRKLGLSRDEARTRVEVYSGLETLGVSTPLIVSAIDLSRLDSVSFWEALIVRAAVQAGCDILYSEDLQHPRKFGRLKVVNPFI